MTNRFKMGGAAATTKGGVDALLETGPLPATTEPAARPAISAEDPIKAFEQRMVATFTAKRNPINISAAATPEIKAALAVIGRLAEDTIGSRQFTESAIIRGLVELLLESHVDWRTALAQLSPEQVVRPTDAVKAILVAQIMSIDHSASSIEHL